MQVRFPVLHLLHRLRLMISRMLRRLKPVLIGLAFLLAGPPLLYGLFLLLYRPARSDEVRPLYHGVEYRRRYHTDPRPVVMHTVVVDLSTPGVELFVTPGEPTAGREIAARTTTAFLRHFGLQLAVNGGFFEPFRMEGLFDFYPYSGDPVDVTGQAISSGKRYGDPRDTMRVLCVDAGGRVTIRDEVCPDGTRHGISGFPLVRNGRADIPIRSWPEPRTAVGLDARGRRLFLMVVDGRQPRFSQGLSLDELADALIAAGSLEAINLDGGGSSTLAVDGLLAPYPLSSPIHTRLPMRQRPVANHLGVRALPLP